MKLKNIFNEIITEKVKEMDKKPSKLVVGSWTDGDGVIEGYAYTQKGYVMYLFTPDQWIFNNLKFERNKSVESLIRHYTKDPHRANKSGAIKERPDGTLAVEFIDHEAEELYLVDKDLLKNLDKDTTFKICNKALLAYEDDRLVAIIMTMKQ